MPKYKLTYANIRRDLNISISEDSEWIENRDNKPNTPEFIKRCTNHISGRYKQFYEYVEQITTSFVYNATMQLTDNEAVIKITYCKLMEEIAGEGTFVIPRIVKDKDGSTRVTDYFHAVRELLKPKLTEV
jgi:hypothetical protein